MHMFRILLVALFLAASVSAFGKGGSEHICSNNLTPEHKAKPQTGPCPFVLSATKIPTGYTVKLSGDKPDKKFKGFALQGRTGNPANGAPIGKFQHGAGAQTIDCKGPADVRDTSFKNFMETT